MIVTLTTNAVIQRITDHHVQLILGRKPIDLPPRLAELAVELVCHRRPSRAALGRPDDHAWLFPGVRPGQHLSSHHLNARLKAIGIAARPARNTTLMDLAAQLPATVLSSLLGLGITTSTAWTHHAGPRTSYATELVRRQNDKPGTDKRFPIGTMSTRDRD